MSAVYALGVNRSAGAVEPLLSLLQNDSNGYVAQGRLAWAWANLPRGPRCLLPLIRALQVGRSGRAALAAAGSLRPMPGSTRARPGRPQARSQLLLRACGSTVSLPFASNRRLRRSGVFTTISFEPVAGTLVGGAGAGMLKEHRRDRARLGQGGVGATRKPRRSVRRIQTLVEEGLLS